MSVFDLKSISYYDPTFSMPLKGPGRVQRSIHLLAVNGFLFKTRIQQVRSSVRRQSPSQNIHLFGSVHVHGLCTVDRPGKPARHRNLSSRIAFQSLPYWYSWKHLSQHVSRRQRKTRLANLSGFRTGSDHSGKGALHPRRIWSHIRQRGLCTRLNNHRSVPDAVSMGSVSQTQKCRQDAYTIRPERVDSMLYTYLKRQSSRCQCTRHSAIRSGVILHHGQSLYRLRTTLQFYKEHGVFYYASQNQSGIYPMRLSTGRQNNRTAKRSNHSPQNPEKSAVLPRATSLHYVLRRRYRQAICVFDKQLHAGCIDHCTTVQMPLEDRTVLQMDQATFANQSILRNFRKCRQNTNLDRRQHLLNRRYYEKRTEFAAEFIRNPVNSQHHDFSKRPYYTSTYEN
jgi:hypothetical protein